MEHGQIRASKHKDEGRDTEGKVEKMYVSFEPRGVISGNVAFLQV